MTIPHDEKPARRRRKKQPGKPLAEVVKFVKPEIEKPVWLDTAIDPTSTNPDTMPELALRTKANALFAAGSANDKQYARLKIDLSMTTEDASKAASVTLERARELDQGVCRFVAAYRARTPVLDRGAIIRSYQDLYNLARERGAAGVKDCAKILEKISELGGIGRPAPDLTFFDSGADAESMARSVMEHISQSKITPEDGQRIMASTKAASEIAINNQLANPPADQNPHNAGTIPWQNHEQLKVAERNARLIWEKLDREKEERKALIEHEDSK